MSYNTLTHIVIDFDKFCDDEVDKFYLDDFNDTDKDWTGLIVYQLFKKFSKQNTDMVIAKKIITKSINYITIEFGSIDKIQEYSQLNIVLMYILEKSRKQNQMKDIIYKFKQNCLKL